MGERKVVRVMLSKDYFIFLLENIIATYSIIVLFTAGFVLFVLFCTYKLGSARRRVVVVEEKNGLGRKFVSEGSKNCYKGEKKNIYI